MILSKPVLSLAAAAALLALPAAAQANQTLTVEKAGAGLAGGSVASSPAGIACGPTCSFSFADGTPVVLTATPGPNSQPATWTGCDNVNGEGKCEVTMSQAKTVKASFALVKRKLTVSPQGDSTGTVTSSPAGIECGATCEAEYTHGTLVVLTGAPTAPHTAPPAWTGCGFVNAADQCEVTMSAAKEVKASFDLERHKLTVMTTGNSSGTVQSSPAGINCGFACAAEYEHGTTVTLSATPAAHTSVQWSGCDSVNGEGKCVVSMTEAKTVTANFALIQFPLTVTKTGAGAPNSSVSSTPAGISCGQTCTALYTEGTTVTLTGSPGPNTKPAQWSGCTSIGKKGECLVTLNAAKSIGASFEPQSGRTTATLTVEKQGEGTGTVSGSPGGIDCGPVCSTELIEGATVTLNATPGPESAFERWSGGGCSGSGACVVTLAKAKTVTAVFSLAGTRTLSVSKAGSGKGTVTSKAAGIDCGQTCSAQVPAEKKLTLTAKAAKGSTFSHWSGACSGTAKSCKVVMSEARSVTATFTAPPTSSPAGSSPQGASARCVVPKLKGKTLKQAKKALKRAHCALGKVKGPKRHRGSLRVRSSKPGAGTKLAAGGKVAVKLGAKGKAKGHR